MAKPISGGFTNTTVRLIFVLDICNHNTVLTPSISITVPMAYYPLTTLLGISLQFSLFRNDIIIYNCVV
jgi:hypothetical protein